jgi:hypothetical protein
MSGIIGFIGQEVLPVPRTQCAFKYPRWHVPVALYKPIDSSPTVTKVFDVESSNAQVRSRRDLKGLFRNLSAFDGSSGSFSRSAQSFSHRFGLFQHRQKLKYSNDREDSSEPHDLPILQQVLPSCFVASAGAYRGLTT